MRAYRIVCDHCVIDEHHDIVDTYDEYVTMEDVQIIVRALQNIQTKSFEKIQVTVKLSFTGEHAYIMGTIDIKNGEIFGLLNS